MKSYFRLITETINGNLKPNRTGIPAYTVPCLTFKHDLSNGFPLLTTKKMAFKSICVELEGFIKGITSKHWYQERGCHIWDEWANPIYCKLYDKNPKEVDDLGPLGYAWGWRRFNMAYNENDTGWIEGYEKRADQLQTIIYLLKTDPNSRRMVCSAWNPLHNDMGALYPCHILWGLVHIEGTLHLYWTQRSCDLMLGVPFNIASYALLLILLCEETHMRPGTITGLLADCHIYKNHLRGAIQQLERDPKPLPTVYIPNRENFNILEWDHKNIIVENYNPYPKISFEVAV